MYLYVYEGTFSGKDFGFMNEKRRPQGRNFPPRPAQAAPAEETEGQLEGRNALQEALRSGRTIDKVFIADGDTDRGLQRLPPRQRTRGQSLSASIGESWTPCPSPTPIRV